MDGVDLQTRWRDAEIGQLWAPHGDLPDEAPLVMPVQSLTDGPPCAGRPASSPERVEARRAVLIAVTAAAALFATWRVGRLLLQDQLGMLDIAILAVFVCLFAWITFWLATAVAGFVETLRGRSCPLGVDLSAPLPQLNARTALLAPIYNEDAQQVFARLQAVCESVEATGQGLQFDLFVLSDSTDEQVAAAERRAFETLRERLPLGPGVYYRRRAENTERKSGNIAEWVRRFGGAYSFMVVLDADSLMTGETLARLAGAMEANPGVGLIQTLPRIVNRSNLFGRTLQFASRLYGPLLAKGLAWWSGAEGNYWGHNAIIRTRAFAAAAGLPSLSGPKPFGGPIMSHDFVEAALIRRAGYGVHMIPELEGSYEECPPTLDALIQRDRRWCQGNLQHLRVLGARGLHWTSRLHLLNGALAYLTAPLWFALLSMSVLLPLAPHLGGGLAEEIDTAPAAARHDVTVVAWLFVISMSSLIAPKLLAYGLAMADRGERRRFGGWLRTAGGLGLEFLMSVLIAPVMMLSQTRLVLDLLLGRDSGWSAQQRDEDRFDLWDACACHGWHTLVGAFMGAMAWRASPMVFLWLSPVLTGLLLSIPISLLIARRDLGLAARAAGLLATPEEGHPPAILARANQLARHYAPAVRSPMIGPRHVPALEFAVPLASEMPAE